MTFLVEIYILVIPSHIDLIIFLKKTLVKYFYISGYDINSYHSFFKIKVKDVGSTYIKVKVKNDTTIIIKNGAHETTYTVTSYSIKK